MATPEGFSGQNYFPDGVLPENFYRPVDRGFEREMHKRIDYFNKLRKKKKKLILALLSGMHYGVANFAYIDEKLANR